jgi:hypothetical protein
VYWRQIVRVLALPALLAVASLGLADKPKPAEVKAKEEQVVTSKAGMHTPATAVNFKKALNLPFPSLGTLGSRIEAARRKPDPVALAHTASEPAVAEKVSGKKARIHRPVGERHLQDAGGARRQQVVRHRAQVEPDGPQGLRQRGRRRVGAAADLRGVHDLHLEPPVT